MQYQQYDADTICQRVTSRVQQGSIVLFHNAALHTPEALPAILTCLINDGYTVVPISQLILPQPYTIDHTGRQFAAESLAEWAKKYLKVLQFAKIRSILIIVLYTIPRTMQVTMIR